MQLTTSILLLVLLQLSPALGQSYVDGKFRKINYTYSDKKYKYSLYDFSRAGATIKAKYFAYQPYEQYKRWSEGKKILLVTAGAFSDSLETRGRPIGLCVDNGKTVTKMTHPVLDGSCRLSSLYIRRQNL